MNKKIQIVNILITICICLIINSISYVHVIKYINDSGGSKANTNTNTINIGTNKDNKTNINTASKEELENLHGIGSKLADKIIESRPYNSIWDLTKVEGIGKETVSNLKEVLTVE